jgi:hypothetical protein
MRRLSRLSLVPTSPQTSSMPTSSWPNVVALPSASLTSYKLEAELCTRLNWRLLPKYSEIQELMGALSKPQSPFWLPWINAPAPSPKAETVEPPTVVTRIPHAKTVAGSLSHFFGVQADASSQQDEAAPTAPPITPAGTAAGGGAQPVLTTGAPSGGAAGNGVRHQGERSASAEGGSFAAKQRNFSSSSSSKGGDTGVAMEVNEDGSPRTVVNRAFSFSNLFGLGRCLYVLLCIFLLEKEKIYLFNREVDNSCERPRDRDRQFRVQRGTRGYHVWIPGPQRGTCGYHVWIPGPAPVPSASPL